MTPCCNQPGSLERISMSTSIFCCLLLSFIYVASLYIWNYKHNRDHPSTIKRRFCSVLVVMVIAPIFVYKFSAPELLEKEGFVKMLGIRTQGLVLATVAPIVLTWLLFLGPICAQYQRNKKYLESFANILWVRNHIVAPLSEEFVFRACMMPLLLQSFSPISAVFITPLFFGTAHIHHIVEHLNMGMDLRSAIIVSCFQLSYTTVFGFYSSFLFARTGHFVAPFLAHAFCNHMGFPDLQNLWQQNFWKRVVLIICYIAGLVSWILLLPLFTSPHFYGSVFLDPKNILRYKAIWF